MRRLRPLALAVLAACSQSGTSDPRLDTGLGGLDLETVAPETLIPGSRLVVRGASFVSETYGASELHLVGKVAGSDVDVRVPLTFVDYDRLEATWSGGAAFALPPSGQFIGDATVVVESSVDGETYESPVRSVTLDFAERLEPRADAIQEGDIYVNEPLAVDGDGFLLGDEEGVTVAVVAGCFKETGQAICRTVGPVEIEGQPETTFDRTRLSFPFHPRIAGIKPGTFMGTVALKNKHGGGETVSGAPIPVEYEVLPPRVTGFAPQVASLGQYVLIDGGGFVGSEPDMPGLVTTLHLEGTFTKTGQTAGTPVTLDLIAEFVTGHRVRYVISEDDELGEIVDLRKEAGNFVGSVKPTIGNGTTQVEGATVPVAFGIGHVKQVIWIRFLPSYVESLRHFGLRAVDARIRERVLEVARRDYAGVNIDFRTEPPSDFALYSTVELAGPDPNGKGLFGYDNTPGKDIGNLRLYDKIGGVNATTLEDGNEGYGGVFIESFFRLGKHPGKFGELNPDMSDEIFDQIIDPFRPDVGGVTVSAPDVAGISAWRTDSVGCPSAGGDRKEEVRCAVFVLGSLIGTTMTHEIGHSLGLANPTQSDPHNYGDEPNRLMDAGGARPVRERAELDGQGPSVFCKDEYDYLRRILPSEAAATTFERPPCR